MFGEDDAQLRLTRALVAFFLILVIAVSFAALIQKEKSAIFSVTTSMGSARLAIFDTITYNLLTFSTFTHHLSTFLTPFILDVNVAPVFNNSTRVEIYDFIKANPGVQFRGICSQLGLSIGLAEFHLGVLKKAGLISFIRDGRYKRFFESKKFSQKEMEIISLLRHDTTRSILRTMLEGKKISHSELACQLSITSQGLTWQMNRLKKDGVIQESKNGMKVIYSLEDTYVPMLSEIINIIEQA
ncbi:MAG TPA: winged helix-turn-helix transcriptional regulator [Candidatus Bathyarchaeia archaeon]|nr:winged helix-turn-helix transcriptional regulator [Candidatus Bathyarchaeia archaeon]